MSEEEKKIYRIIFEIESKNYDDSFSKTVDDIEKLIAKSNYDYSLQLKNYKIVEVKLKNDSL